MVPLWLQSPVFEMSRQEQSFGFRSTYFGCVCHATLLFMYEQRRPTLINDAKLNCQYLAPAEPNSKEVCMESLFLWLTTHDC